VRHPEPGEFQAAGERFNARIDALPEHARMAMAVHLGTGAVDDDQGLASHRLVYGDLLMVDEVAIGNRGLVAQLAAEIFSGQVTTLDALMTVALQSTAVGVLMERARWERGK
jgi:hypothetical protein